MARCNCVALLEASSGFILFTELSIPKMRGQLSIDSNDRKCFCFKCNILSYSQLSIARNDFDQFKFVETPRKFTIAKLLIRKIFGPSSELTLLESVH